MSAPGLEAKREKDLRGNRQVVRKKYDASAKYTEAIMLPKMVKSEVTA
jgi:hypothetical protein